MFSSSSANEFLFATKKHPITQIQKSSLYSPQIQNIVFFLQIAMPQVCILGPDLVEIKFHSINLVGVGDVWDEYDLPGKHGDGDD